MSYFVSGIGARSLAEQHGKDLLTSWYVAPTVMYGLSSVANFCGEVSAKYFGTVLVS